MSDIGDFRIHDLHHLHKIRTQYYNVVPRLSL